MNPFQSLFDAQKSYFASNITRSHAWRVEQLDRMGKIIKENEAALRARGVSHAALFGSRARGDNRADSDIDIMVEFDPVAHVTVSTTPV